MRIFKTSEKKVPVDDSFQGRVIAEKVELDNKIQALTNFKDGEIYANLTREDKVDLTKQLRLMRGYSQILASRISRF